MKRITVAIALVCIAASAFAVDFATFKPGFDQFAQDLANGGALNATTGLNWSTTPGGSSHIGIGLTVGATTIPAASVTAMATALGITLPAEFSYLQIYGVPVPSYTIDARIGFGLPLDIGLKVGYIPASLLSQAGAPFTADVLIAGGDVRYALLADQGLLPGITIGVGYTYMKESVGVSGLIPSMSVGNVGGHTLSLTSPVLSMNSQTSIVEAKLQVSKQILFLTPYVGAAASYSFGSSASGSVASTLLYDGSPIQPADIAQIDAYYTGLGQTPPDLSSVGITASATAASGLNYRVYGGVSLDLLILAVDLNATYSIVPADFTKGALGASVNVRLAL